MADTFHETPRVTPCAPQNKPRPARKRRPVGWVDHHIVGTLPGCTAHFQNPSTGYATNYGIGSGDGRGGGGWWINEFVPADEVAYGNGNEHLNEVAISVEHENDLRLGIAGKPRPEVHELSARFMAACAVRFDWRIKGKVQLVLRDFPNHDFYGKRVPGFGTEFNVIGHSAVALKDCPRDLDMQWKVNRANQILADGEAPIIEEVFGMAGRMYFARVRKEGESLVDDGEWMIAGVDIPPHPLGSTAPDATPEQRLYALQDGYRVTTDKVQALIWARQYSFSPAKTLSVQLPREQYVAQQEFARRDAAEWRQGIRNAVK
ncbi:hypothetical protein ABIQ69_11570 [Agromyces sp. G08B096]|uniref:Uncharacterized protein n=1 Tax=Agromyces sp. G08B096 TaxID=3156399 RepID=A0AAU7W734_9MICO